MATGTNAGLLDIAKPTSIYKHVLLDQYVIRYATMTSSKLPTKRAVLVDGFAGRGRFTNGKPASAEHMMRAALKVTSRQIDSFLIEQNASDFKLLSQVADEYREQGINVETRNGDCGAFISEAVEWAQGASLFLFLDPCGANIPWDRLQPLLTRRGSWPRTEALLNFSADLIRRAGGQYKQGQLDSPAIAVVDRVCGGPWWREVALHAHLSSGA